MDADWVEFKEKSGQTLFIYNKVTAEHRWLSANHNDSLEGNITHGKIIQYKQLRSVSTQTDNSDYYDECTSVSIDSSLSNLNKTSEKHTNGFCTSTQGQIQPQNTLNGAHSEPEIPSAGTSGIHCDSESNDDGWETVSCNQVTLEDLDITYPPKRIREKKHKCPTCNKMFRDKQKLANHVRTHTGEKPFKCHLCEKAFGVKISLTKHLQVHKGERPHKCPVCGKGFIDKPKLTYHIRGHTGEKPFKCDICGKSWVSNSGLIQHRRTHTAKRQTEEKHVEVKTFKCSYCDKVLLSKAAWVVHIRVHTGEKPLRTFKCSFCDKFLSKKSSLHQHLRTQHTGENPYKCPICDKACNKHPELYLKQDAEEDGGVKK